MNFLTHPMTIMVIVHALIVILITIRVIMVRPETGVAFAWLLIVAMFPFVGAFFYLLIGERRTGLRSKQKIDTLQIEYKKVSETLPHERFTDIDWSRHAPSAHGMDRLGRKAIGTSTVKGSSFQLFSDTQEMLTKIARDVDEATTSVLMAFYIWNEGGTADEVLEALIRAAKRGVSCRVIVDAFGARPWWRSTQPQQLRDAGVQLQEALPVTILHSFVGRPDLRLHRKIVVVDSKIAWTGSMNLVDPRLFKQGAGVGEWVDALARLEGPVVAQLAAVLIGDWMLGTDESLQDIITNAQLHVTEPQGDVDIQVIPSGPQETGDGLLQMLLALIYSAEEELVLTTPYLVLDDSMLYALRSAAGRGVKVTLIVPEKVDSFPPRYASRSYYDDLLEMGVEIYLYRRGLLHTKSIMADGARSMFGTVNLDLRSFWLDYEVALFVYDPGFAQELRALQQTYLDDSDRVDPADWGTRTFKERFLENLFRLVSPLL